MGVNPTLLYTHPNIFHLSLLSVNSLYPALFSLRARLPSGVPGELIGSYYHKLKSGAVSKGSELASDHGQKLVRAKLYYVLNDTAMKRCVHFPVSVRIVC
jgi:hypothetical protein